MKKLFLGITLLVALSACGQVETPEPLPPTPTQRVAPSPEPVPATETVMPTETALPPISVPESSTANADADVTYVRAVQAADGSWTFYVTVSHPDTGWEDYANGWDILTLNGTQLKIRESDVFTRLLAHSHVDEQPFTRSQRGIIILEGVTQVIVRAHDIVDGFGGKEIIVDLEKDSGEDFIVER